ncbi:hypothetical protein ACNOYE_08670 [Nannocystaceae bacterium ST9]
MKKNTSNKSKRVLGRQVAKELSKTELTAIVGALPPNTTCSAGCPDDCG